MADHPPARTPDAIGIGLVGAGAFGEFCLAAFAEMPDVRIAAVADTDFARAERLAAPYQATAYPSLDALLNDRQVQIVALNTPPFLHGAQGVAVLEAGRHLFCEKPLATSIADAERLIDTARQRQLQITVDYVMRFNPYWTAAAALAKSGVLGELRHMDLSNHANGLALPASHWFWDEQKSGGIWVEHGVHFFDAFSWVSGQPGEAIGAAAYTRPDGSIDRVEGLFRYGDAAAHCYHAFDQSGQTEQTTVRLTFRNGYITLPDWIPTALHLQTTIAREAWATYLPNVIHVSSGADGQITASSDLGLSKRTLYRMAIQDGMRQLIAAVSAAAPLVVTGQHGLQSLITAVAASELASHRPC